MAFNWGKAFQGAAMGALQGYSSIQQGQMEKEWEIEKQKIAEQREKSLYDYKRQAEAADREASRSLETRRVEATEAQVDIAKQEATARAEDRSYQSQLRKLNTVTLVNPATGESRDVSEEEAIQLSNEGWRGQSPSEANEAAIRLKIQLEKDIRTEEQGRLKDNAITIINALSPNVSDETRESLATVYATTEGKLDLTKILLEKSGTEISTSDRIKLVKEANDFAESQVENMRVNNENQLRAFTNPATGETIKGKDAERGWRLHFKNQFTAEALGGERESILSQLESRVSKESGTQDGVLLQLQQQAEESVSNRESYQETKQQIRSLASSGKFDQANTLLEFLLNTDVAKANVGVRNELEFVGFMVEKERKKQEEEKTQRLQQTGSALLGR